MIEYADYINSKNKNKVKKIYNYSFPKNEQIPFWILRKTSKSDNVLFKEIILNNKTIGFIYLIFIEDIAYLMYLSIDKHLRNKGYGSIILKKLTHKFKTVILSIEKVNDNNPITQKRKNFYLKNGFYETNKLTKQNNVYYELLCSSKNYNLTKKGLINIYKKMTNSKFLSFFINKRFKLFDINLTDENNI